MPLLSGIHRCADKLHELARLVQNGMTDRVLVLDSAVGKDDAIVRPIVGLLDFTSCEGIQHPLSVLWMNSVEPEFGNGNVLVSLGSIDPEHFGTRFRPCRDPARCEIVPPTPRVAKPLG